jgi:hypothetical protein
VFILEHYFTLKLFAAVCEAFSNVYPDKKVANKTVIHQLVTTLWDTGSVCVSLRRWLTSAVKLISKIFLTNTKKQLICLVILLSLKLTNTAVVRVAF